MFVIVPVVDGAVTTIVSVAFPPFARLPTVHVTVPEAFVQPVDADTNPTPVGSVSVTATPVASLGPPLWTERV